MRKFLLVLLANFIGVSVFGQVLVNEGFEGTAIPSGWTYSGFDRIISSTETPCTGDAAVLSSISSAQLTASILYSATNSNGKAISISFKYKAIAKDPANPAVSGNVKFEYSQGNLNSFTQVGSLIDLSAPTGSCSTFTGTMPFMGTTGAYKYRITANNTGSGDWKLMIDDVSIVQSICYTPIILDPTNITSNSAQVNWSASNIPANGVDVYCSTSNTAPSSATVPTISGASGTSLTINSLLPGTTYYVWDRANCGTEISDWSLPKTFTTLCSQNLPYHEDFETVYSGLPVCTTQQNQSGSWMGYAMQSGLGFSQGRVFYYNFNNVSAVNSWWFTPKFNLQAGTMYVLKFKKGNESIKSAVTHRLKIAYGTSANSVSMNNVIKDFTTAQNSNAESETLYFTPSIDGVYSLGFNIYTPTGVTGKGSFFLDDVSVEVSNNCLIPNNILAGSITQNSAVINWDASISIPAEGYDLYYSTSDIEPTASTVPNYQSIFGLSQNLSSLVPGQKYYVWIRSRCSSSQFSDWKETIFFTGCQASYSVPYTEDFESSFAGGLPNCTSVQSQYTGSDWTVYNNYYYYYTGGNSIYWPTKALHFNIVTNGSSWFFTGGVNLEAGKQYKIAYQYGKGSPLVFDKLKIMYGSVPDAISMTNSLADYQGLPLSRNSAVHTFTVPVTGIYYFGFNTYTTGVADFSRGLAIDNIKIEEDGVLVVSDIKKKDNIAVYPNPFKDVLTISDITGIKSITVNDFSGKLIKSEAPAKELYFQDLNTGIYMISLHYKDNSVKTFKVVKK